MTAGRIEPPSLDDRSWEQIVEDTIKRIPDHCPEWTDHNKSDLGITLIELFAYIADTIIYRLNKVPEKNYLAFLNLLNITRNPPEPATVSLTFSGTPGTIVPKGTQVCTKPSEQDEPIVFETDQESVISQNGSGVVSASNALTTRGPEILGKSDGKPHQVFCVKNAPLYKDLGSTVTFHHLQVSVGDETWSQVDEFEDGQNKRYMSNPVTGEIIFGKENLGGIPPQGALIRAMRYRYTIGGFRGNVPADTLTLIKTPIDGVVGVTNDGAASGGTEWEPFEDTLRRAPLEIKNRNRAVTAGDYEHLAQEATTEVAKVRCLGPKKKPDGTYETDPFDRSPGKVNLIIVPNDKTARKPEPADNLLEEVKNYLDDRRVITSDMMVRKPDYAEIAVEAKVYVPKGLTEAQKENVKKVTIETLQKFLQPVSGGPDGKGWEIGQDIYIPQIFDAINKIPQVLYVDALKISMNGSTVEGIRAKVLEHQVACAAVEDQFHITVEEETEEL